jgi:hypothetical protein
VFGCGFSIMFEPLVGSRTALDEEHAQLKAGKPVSDSVVAAVTSDLSAAVTRVRLCEGSAGARGRAPRSVMAALQSVAAQAGTVRRSSSSFRVKLGALARRMDAALGGFPAVFGIPYAQLVDQVAALDSAMSLAEQRVHSGDTRGAASALSTAVAPSTAVTKALIHHQKQVIKAENANG